MNAIKFTKEFEITSYRFDPRYRTAISIARGKVIISENAIKSDTHCVTVRNAFGATGSGYEATKDAAIQAAIRECVALEADVRKEVAIDPSLKKSRAYNSFNF